MLAPSLVVAAILASVCVLMLAVKPAMGRRSKLGTFPCALLDDSGKEHRGRARYMVRELSWTPDFSFGIQTKSWDRCFLHPQEIAERPDGSLEVRCLYRGHQLHFVMSRGAFDGFVSWLEAGPSRVSL